MSGRKAEELKARLRELADEAARVHGFRVAWIEYAQQGAAGRFAVYLEKESGSLEIDDCAFYSRQLAARLELDDAIPGTYKLEVSSPGLDRPLFDESDYERFAGERIKAVFVRALEGRKSMKGTIKEASAGKVTLEDEESGVTLEVGLEDIKRANLAPELPW